MNSLLKQSPTPDATTRRGRSTPEFGERSAMERLADSAAEISESEMMDLLDGSARDETVLAAIIARPYLTDAVIIRLLGLVSPALFDRLLARHPLPEKYRREVGKRRSGRPSWWSHGLLNIGR